MRTFTFQNDVHGRQQLELLWVAVSQHQAPRRRAVQQSHVRLLEKIEAITDAVPAEALAHVPPALRDQRTIADRTGPRALVLEEAERLIALGCLDPLAVSFTGSQARIAEALLTALEDGPTEEPSA